MKQTIQTIFAVAFAVCVAQTAVAQQEGKPKQEPGVMVTNERYTQCFEVVYKKWGEHCDSKDSFEVRWKNICTENMDLKYAVRKKDGTWEIGIDFNVAPSEETVRTSWTCHASGHFVWWARPSERWMDVQFPSDEEIQKAK
jgi:hypothetical protein